MAEYRHLNNAPITEAIIDLRVRLPSEFQVKNFSSLRETLHDQYPGVEERRLITGAFGIEAGKPVMRPPVDKGIEGYLFRSANNTKVVQFKKEGFTFSRLKPYTDWEDVSAKAKDLWELYVAKAFPELVTRIAVRYINHLKIPLPINDFLEYLTVPPRVPDNAPQDVSTFLSRVVVHDLQMDIAANITQALEKSVEPNYATVILDIDVYKRGEFAVGINDIWPVFAQLHDLKNRIFFGSITERTARLFE